MPETITTDLSCFNYRPSRRCAAATRTALMSDRSSFANDRTILAAAPDMLAALKAMTTAFYLYQRLGDAFDRQRWDRAEFQARKAIAKAEGRL
jgi:hypothetical protein